MLSLNLPVFDTKIATRNGKNVIFDVIAVVMSHWPLKNGSVSTLYTFLLFIRGIRRLWWQMKCCWTWTGLKNDVTQCYTNAILVPEWLLNIKLPTLRLRRLFLIRSPAIIWFWKLIIWLSVMGCNTIVAGWIMILKVIRFCRIFRIMTLYKINNVNDSFRHLLSSFQEVNIVNARS